MARDLGKTVFEISRLVSSYELIQWMAFYKLEYDEREQAQAKANETKEQKTKADRVNYLKAKFKTQIGAYNRKIGK